MSGGQASIRVIPGSRPQQCWSTRPIPVNLQAPFDKELDAQIQQGIIEPANDANDPAMWLHPMVVTRKKDPTKCRITVDLRAINKATLRPVYPSQSPWQAVSTVSPHSRVYTVLDGLKGYHQVELDIPSRKLLTFVTPRGRMRYRRLPMGWHGAGDLYHERLTTALAEVPKGIHTRIVEDILIHTPEGGEAHQAAVRTVLQACQKHQISINVEKAQYGKTKVVFAGFLLEGGQYSIDPELSTALREFPRPTNRTELRSFLGLAQQVGYFTEEITHLTAPLRDLNTKGVKWIWNADHEQAFGAARRALSSTQCLAPFDPALPTELLTDASKAGLGFLLRQRGRDGAWHPTQCGSRSLAGHEANWSGAAELEALAVAWAAKRASFFLDGLHHFVIVTDSSPLVSILNDRRLDQIQNDRLLKLKTAMARFNFTVRHQAGDRHLIADALSRAPVAPPAAPDLVLTAEEDTDRSFIVAAAVATADTGAPDLVLDPIRRAAAEDTQYQDVVTQTEAGWPTKPPEPHLAPYWHHRADLTVHEGLILYGPRILIPRASRKQATTQLHAAHQGINKTRERAARTVWWPTINNDIEQAVGRCTTCRETLPSLTHQPLLHGPRASRPFQTLHLDLCHHGGEQYLVITDEYSGWPDLAGLGRDASAAAIIDKLRRQFLAHTVPEAVRPDNGPQFTASETRQFLALWQVRVEPSAPYLPRTNGRAEAAVKAMKKILRGSSAGGRPDADQLAEGIIAYRNTPRYGGRSPAEWVYGRNLKDRLPTHHSAFDPRWQRDWAALDTREETTKRKANARYDGQARAHTPLSPGDPVWVQNHVTQRWTIPGTVLETEDHDAYLVRHDSGRVYRRNRVHLRRRLAEEGEQEPLPEPPSPPAATEPTPEGTRPPAALRPPATSQPPAVRTTPAPPTPRRSRRPRRTPARYQD